jgi:uncharacterized membrane-anchored protein YitT (DUF2179 family)
LKGIWRDYLGITVGCAFTALALDMFLVPNKIAAGGTSGIATVLHYLFGWPVGLTMLALELPLFLAGVKVLGTRFGVKTLYGAVVLSVLTDLFVRFVPVLTSDVLLNSLYGGVLSGIGMGLVFKFKGTTGGTDHIAAIANKLFHVRIGQALLATDFIVITGAGIAFHSANAALYALITLFVTAQIIDLVQEGSSSSKAFIIMTCQPEAVSRTIMAELGRGVTLLQAKGGFTGQQREVVLSVVSASEISRVKDIVYQIDSKAFVIVTDAHEVLGEGFTEISRDC